MATQEWNQWTTQHWSRQPIHSLIVNAAITNAGREVVKVTVVFIMKKGLSELGCDYVAQEYVIFEDHATDKSWNP